MTTRTERDVHRLLRQASRQPVSVSELAAYVAGTLDETERPLIEARLRHDPYASVVVRASRDTLENWREEVTARNGRSPRKPGGTVPEPGLRVIETPGEVVAAAAVPGPGLRVIETPGEVVAAAAAGPSGFASDKPDEGECFQFQLASTSIAGRITVGVLYRGRREVLIVAETTSPAEFGTRLRVKHLPSLPAQEDRQQEGSAEFALLVDAQVAVDRAGGSFRCDMTPEQWARFTVAVHAGDFIELLPPC
jgi:hypothetical protein